jgi:hypothetical protein
LALISKSIIRKIESELYDYPLNLKTINEQREDILHGSHYPDVSVSGGEMSNTTQSKGMRLARLETGWVDLITEALVSMPMQYSLLIRHKYFGHKNNDMTAEALYISRALYFAWKESAILCLALIATQRGLVNPTESQQLVKV